MSKEDRFLDAILAVAQDAAQPVPDAAPAFAWQSLGGSRYFACPAPKVSYRIYKANGLWELWTGTPLTKNRCIAHARLLRDIKVKAHSAFAAQ